MKKSEHLSEVINGLQEMGWRFDTCRKMLIKERFILEVCEKSTCDPSTARLVLAQLGSVTMHDSFLFIEPKVQKILVYHSNIGTNDAVIIQMLKNSESMQKALSEIPN